MQLKLRFWLWKEEIYWGQTPQNVKLKLFLQKNTKTSTPQDLNSKVKVLHESYNCGFWGGWEFLDWVPKISLPDIYLYSRIKHRILARNFSYQLSSFDHRWSQGVVLAFNKLIDIILFADTLVVVIITISCVSTRMLTHTRSSAYSTPHVSNGYPVQ